MKKLLYVVTLSTLFMLPSFSAVEESDQLSLIYYRDEGSDIHFQFFKKGDISAQEAVKIIKNQVGMRAHGFNFIVSGNLLESEDSSLLKNVDTYALSDWRQYFKEESNPSGKKVNLPRFGDLLYGKKQYKSIRNDFVKDDFLLNKETGGTSYVYSMTKTMSVLFALVALVGIIYGYYFLKEKDSSTTSTKTKKKRLTRKKQNA